MLGFPLLYFKGMRLMMFQLSSFYCMTILNPYRIIGDFGPLGFIPEGRVEL